MDPKGDLVRFIYHLLRQFFKKLQEYPLLVIDVFAPKPKKVCLELNIGRLEAEKADLEVSAKKEKRYVLLIDLQKPLWFIYFKNYVKFNKRILFCVV